MEKGDQVMADRGSKIKEELLPYFCGLEVSPGAWIQSQMISAEVKKIKHVANLQIHVERPINRIKSLIIPKNTLPLSLL